MKTDAVKSLIRLCEDLIHFAETAIKMEYGDTSFYEEEMAKLKPFVKRLRALRRATQKQR